MVYIILYYIILYYIILYYIILYYIICSILYLKCVLRIFLAHVKEECKNFHIMPDRILLGIYSLLLCKYFLMFFRLSRFDHLHCQVPQYSSAWNCLPSDLAYTSQNNSILKNTVWGSCKVRCVQASQTCSATLIVSWLYVCPHGKTGLEVDRLSLNFSSYFPKSLLFNSNWIKIKQQWPVLYMKADIYFDDMSLSSS